MPEEQKPLVEKKLFDVHVVMSVSEDGNEVESRKIDFGKVREDQLKALRELFLAIASNVEAIRSMAPLYEKLGNSKPSYLK